MLGGHGAGWAAWAGQGSRPKDTPSQSPGLMFPTPYSKGISHKLREGGAACDSEGNYHLLSTTFMHQTTAECVLRYKVGHDHPNSTETEAQRRGATSPSHSKAMAQTGPGAER